MCRDSARTRVSLRLGGIRPAAQSDAGAYVDAGAASVGIGSAIADDDAVANGEYGIITENARRTVDAVATARDS